MEKTEKKKLMAFPFTAIGYMSRILKEYWRACSTILVLCGRLIGAAETYPPLTT